MESWVDKVVEAVVEFVTEDPECQSKVERGARFYCVGATYNAAYRENDLRVQRHLKDPGQSGDIHVRYVYQDITYRESAFKVVEDFKWVGQEVELTEDVTPDEVKGPPLKKGDRFLVKAVQAMERTVIGERVADGTVWKLISDKLKLCPPETPDFETVSGLADRKLVQQIREELGLDGAPVETILQKIKELMAGAKQILENNKELHQLNKGLRASLDDMKQELITKRKHWDDLNGFYEETWKAVEAMKRAIHYGSHVADARQTPQASPVLEWASWDRSCLTGSQQEQFETKPVGESSYSMRTTFKVTCKKCHQVLHTNTNNPSAYIDQHVCQ